MPYYKKPPSYTYHANHNEWVAQIIYEFTSDTANGPNIIEQWIYSGMFNVFVIWDAWGDAREDQRSAAVRDAYKQHFGLHKISQMGVVLGLTQAEANAMGLSNEL